MLAPTTAAVASNTPLLEIDGKLSAESIKDKKNKNTPCQVHTVNLKEFTTYVIEMKTGNEEMAQRDDKYRPYLRLEGPGIDASSDDNMPWNPYSETHLILTCTKSGPYKIIATTRGGGEAAFRFSVRQLESQLERPRGKTIVSIPAKPGERVKLAADDPRDDVRGTPCKEYVVEFQKGNLYEIEMRADIRILWPYLRLQRADGRQAKSSSSRDIAGNGSADEHMARLTYYSREAGKFKIFAATYAGQQGDFQLTVREHAPRVHEFVKRSDIQIRDVLTRDDPRDQVLKTSPSKSYWVRFKKGFTYVIELRTLKIGRQNRTLSFDAVLRLEDDGGRELAFNDDEEAGVVGQQASTDSRITFSCKRDGVYRIIATSLDEYYENPAKYPNAGCGVFAVSVQPSPAEKSLAGGHVEFADRLMDADAKDRNLKGSPSKVYSVQLESGKTYQIDLQTNAFHGLVRVRDASYRKLAAFYDITSRSRNASVLFRCERSEPHQIVVTSVDERAGDFALRIKVLKDK